MGVKVYERILQLFEAEGIKTIFGIPDPNFVHMFVAAEKRGWNVVTPHHELASGFMAEGFARMNGTPALCIATLGPGIANAAGAMMCAKVENSPVIFIGGQRARVTAVSSSSSKLRCLKTRSSTAPASNTPIRLTKSFVTRCVSASPARRARFISNTHRTSFKKS
jgi:acetolactate synthase I/II/III large subunit